MDSNFPLLNEVNHPHSYLIYLIVSEVVFLIPSETPYLILKDTVQVSLGAVIDTYRIYDIF